MDTTLVVQICLVYKGRPHRKGDAEAAEARRRRTSIRGHRADPDEEESEPDEEALRIGATGGVGHKDGKRDGK